MINLITVDNQVKDLSVSTLFVSHYNKANSFAKYIIDNEINNGMWFDELLKTLPDDAVIIDANDLGVETMGISNEKITDLWASAIFNVISILVNFLNFI